MFVSCSPGSRRILAGLVFLVALGLASGPVSAEENEEGWTPPPPAPDRYDWIQLKSGEWLKGEIIVLYDDKMDFDSDELDLLKLDWEDIRQVRSAGTMQVGVVGGEVAVGRLVVDGDSIRVIGQGDDTFTRAQLLSITAGEPKEINYWFAKIGLGATLRTGNTEQTDFSLSADIRRRTVRNRLVMTYLGNQSTTFSQTTANSHRASIGWDRFINQRFFLKPVFAEYFRDPFQNIDQRGTLGVGAGYQVIDTKKTDLQVSGGPAYQKTWFVEVEPGESQTATTPALVVSTIFETEIARWLDFDYEYRLQLVNEESGTYNHHMLFNFETEITSKLDFDVKFVWDYIENPQPATDGTVPEQTDFWTIVGLTFDF